MLGSHLVVVVTEGTSECALKVWVSPDIVLGLKHGHIFGAGPETSLSLTNLLEMLSWVHAVQISVSCLVTCSVLWVSLLKLLPVVEGLLCDSTSSN